MYLETLNSSLRKLRDAAFSSDQIDREMEEAFFYSCRALRSLIEDSFFHEDLDRLAALADATAASNRAAELPWLDFESFFIREQLILIDQGLPKDVVLSLGAVAGDLQRGIEQNPFSRNEFMSSLSILTEEVCLCASNLRDINDIRDVLTRTTQGALGAAVGAANAKSLPFEVGLPGIALVASGSMGLYIMKDSVRTEPILERMRAFFRRKRPS